MISKHKRIFQITLITLMLLTTFGLAKPTLAFESDDDGYIPADVVIDDDLIISYSEITIDGTVNGNVFASAEDVVVNGTINGNLMVNAASAQVNGDVTGSIAMADQTMEVNSDVGGTIYFAGVSLILGPEMHANRNILFTGFSLEAQEGSRVELDLSASGYQGTFSGEIGRHLDLEMDAVEINGKIGGDLDARVSGPGEVPELWWMERWVGQFSDTPLPETIAPGLRVADRAAQRTYHQHGLHRQPDRTAAL